MQKYRATDLNQSVRDVIACPACNVNVNGAYVSRVEVHQVEEVQVNLPSRTKTNRMFNCKFCDKIVHQVALESHEVCNSRGY